MEWVNKKCFLVIRIKPNKVQGIPFYSPKTCLQMLMIKEKKKQKTVEKRLFVDIHRTCHQLTKIAAILNSYLPKQIRKLLQGKYYIIYTIVIICEGIQLLAKRIIYVRTCRRHLSNFRQYTRILSFIFCVENIKENFHVFKNYLLLQYVILIYY